MHDSVLQDVLGEIEALIHDTDVELVINDILSKPGLLQYIISGKCDHTSCLGILFETGNSIPAQCKSHL